MFTVKKELRFDDKTILVSHGGNGISYLTEPVDYNYFDWESVGHMNLNIIVGARNKADTKNGPRQFPSGSGMTPEIMAIVMQLTGPDGDPVKTIVAYNAGKTRANKLGPNNNFTDFERYVLANNPKDGKRIVRDAKRLVEAVLPEQFNFPAPVVNMPMPVPKPKRVGGFV